MAPPFNPELQRNCPISVAEIMTNTSCRDIDSRSQLTLRTLLRVASLCVLGISTGCTALTGNRSTEPIDGINTASMRAAGYTFDETGAQRPLPTGDDRPAVILEVRDGKRHLERIPMNSDKPLFIQDIIHDAKLEEKLGNIKVAILRPTGGSNPPIRMEADMEKGGKGVVKWQNYALQPGDQIVVTKDTTNWVDGVMTSMLPFKR